MSKITGSSELHQPDAPQEGPEEASATHQVPSTSKLTEGLIGDPRHIILQVPDRMEDYAARHGAQYDVSNKRWYVIGEVPEGLESFGPASLTRQPLYESSPICPLCGASMVMRYSGNGGDPFWGCSRFPKCKGKVEWEPSLPKSIGTTINMVDETPEQLQRKSASAHELLKRRWEELVALIYVRMGTTAGEKWLFSPHPDLHGKTPAQTMLTWAGGKKVEQLIKKI